MDQYRRAVLSVEEKFFDECDTGNGNNCFIMLYISLTIEFGVPVVVVFTKCDALWATAFAKLKPDDKQLPPEEQFMKVKEYVKELLRDSTGWERLKARQYPPKDFVHLEGKCEPVCCGLVKFVLYRYAQI